MTLPADRSMVEFLTWLAAAPRTYRDVMDVWRSTCPRLSAWEDAVAAGLVELRRGPAMASSAVGLTARGRHVLAMSNSGGPPAAGAMPRDAT